MRIVSLTVRDFTFFVIYIHIYARKYIYFPSFRINKLALNGLDWRVEKYKDAVIFRNDR